MNRTVIIAQARMSSTRLPGKTLMDLAGRPVIDHVLTRARRARRADDVWVATTSDATDDVLCAHLEKLGIRYVRGSLDDVLARYLLAAETADAETIVRITCDCPLIDPDVIDEVIMAFEQSPSVDYCSNTLRRTYPIGMDTEVFSRAALTTAARRAVLPAEREHVTPHIYQHPQAFKLRNVESADWAEWPALRLTLDESSDFEFLSALLGCISADAGLREVLSVLHANEALARINASVPHRHTEKPADWS